MDPDVAESHLQEIRQIFALVGHLYRRHLKAYIDRLFDHFSVSGGVDGANYESGNHLKNLRQNI
jgi:hypothetical protein